MVPENKVERAKLKIQIFTKMLEEISKLSTSSRLKVGCMIFKSDFTKIAAFGYNGNYYNAPINSETGTEEESLEPGKDGFIHAEVNSIAKFREEKPEEYIVIVTHSPCINCAKLLVNSGFKHIYWIQQYRETSHLDPIFQRCKVTYGNLDQLAIDYIEGNSF